MFWLSFVLFPVKSSAGSYTVKNVIDARHHEHGRPQARIASFGWYKERNSLSRTEPSTINMQIEVTPRSDSDVISGSGLWEVAVFASRHEDGSGARYYQERNILSRSQKQYTMRPMTRMVFDVEFEFPMGQVGCDGTAYFCVEFAKGGSANPDFDLPSQQGNDSLVKCIGMTCQFQDHRSTNRALFSSLGIVVRSGPNTPPRGKQNIDVTATIVTNTSSDEIRGTGLWRLGVFGSRDQTGMGERRNEVQNILTDRTASSPLIPGRDLVLQANYDLNLQGIGFGEEFPFLCMEFAKGDSPYPDFTTNLAGDSNVRCASMPGIPGNPPVAVLTELRSIYELGRQHPDGTTDLTVEAIVMPHRDSDQIQGSNLWRVGAYGSTNQEGTGRRYPISDQLLQQPEMRKTLYPESELVLTGTDNVDLRAVGRGTRYPYLCIEFAKNRQARPEYDLELGGPESAVTCHELGDDPHLVKKKCWDDGTFGPQDPNLPTALLSQFDYALATRPASQSHLTEAGIMAIITPMSTTDRITGNDLWRIGVFGNSQFDGSGPRYAEVPQILPPNQADNPLYPNRVLVVEGRAELDLRNIGTGTPFPYLCVEFARAREDAEFNMPIRSPTGTFLSCKPHSGWDDGTFGPQDPNLPTALLSQFDFSFAARPASQSNLTEARIMAIITPMSTTDRITGHDLWRIGVFGNSQSDGSGPRYAEVPQILPPNQADNPLYPNRVLVVEGRAELDLRNIGTGTPFPYLCVEFARAREDAEFNMPINTPTGTFLSCRPPSGHEGGGHEDPDPDMPNAVFQSFQTSIIPTAVPGSHLTELEIEATVTPHSSTDYIPDAQFRLGIFGSRNSDGSGYRRNEITQIVSRDQQTHPVYAGRDVVIEAVTHVDLRGIGDGTNYPYICVEFDRKNEHVGFNMPLSTPTGTVIACREYTPPPDGGTHPGGGDGPRALISGFRNSMRSGASEGGLTEVTIESTITPSDNTDYIRAGENWRLGMFWNQNEDGSARRKREVSQLLSQSQRRQPLYSGRPLDFEVTTDVDLSGVGTGTAFPYLCIEFDRNENAVFDMPMNTSTGTLLSCTEYTPSDPCSVDELKIRGRYTCIAAAQLPAGRVFEAGLIMVMKGAYFKAGPNPEPEPHDEMVVVTAVTPDKNVKAKEKGTADVVFDVSVDVDPSRTSNVSGSNLWVLKVFASKKKTGKGPRHGEVQQALSRTQQSQRIQNGRRLAFTDVSTTLDLSGVKCKDAKYLCAEIMKGSNRDFQLVGESATSTVGCAKLKCSKKSKKDPAAGRTLTISSITPSRVRIFSNNRYTVDFTTDVEFVARQSQALIRGVDLWKMSAWFSKEPNGVKKIGLVEQVLNNNKRNKYVSDPAATFSFGSIQQEFDLRNQPCKKLQYFCVKLTPDNPSPAFTLAKEENNANMGCSRTTCR